MTSKLDFFLAYLVLSVCLFVGWFMWGKVDICMIFYLVNLCNPKIRSSKWKAKGNIASYLQIQWKHDRQEENCTGKLTLPDGLSDQKKWIKDVLHLQVFSFYLPNNSKVWKDQEVLKICEVHWTSWI